MADNLGGEKKMGKKGLKGKPGEKTGGMPDVGQRGDNKKKKKLSAIYEKQNRGGP